MNLKLFFAILIFIATILVSMVPKINSLPSRLNYGVMEEVAMGTEIGHVMKDLEIIGVSHEEITFKFLSPLPSFLAFNPTTSRLITAGRVDREGICNTKDEEDEELGMLSDQRKREGVIDLGGTCNVERALVVQQSGKSTIITLTLHIQDINDNQPAFFPNHIQLPIIESSPKATRFKLPKARDLDGPSYSVARYMLETKESRDSSFFTLDTDRSGDISLVLLKMLDREEKDSYSMRVVAIDSGPPRHSGYLVVKVDVVDSNDNSPVFEKALYEVGLLEDAPFTTQVVRVNASDADLGLNGDVSECCCACRCSSRS